jgi:hypothetical protein
MKFHDGGRSWGVGCVSFHVSGEEEKRQKKWNKKIFFFPVFVLAGEEEAAQY